MRFGPLRLYCQPASLRSRGVDVSRPEFQQGLIWVLHCVLGCFVSSRVFIEFGVLRFRISDCRFVGLGYEVVH